MSINDKLVEVTNKLNTIQGQLLSLAKRVKELEEQEPAGESFRGDEKFLNYLKGYMFGDSEPWNFDGEGIEEVGADSPEEEAEEVTEEEEEVAEVSPETLEKLDQALNNGDE